MTSQNNEKPEPRVIARIQDKGVSLVDPDALERLKKSNLSASLITSLVGKDSCHARWIGDRYVVKEIIDDLDTPARRGNVFHTIMEDFFELPKEERTHENMRTLVDKVLTEDYPDMGAIREVVEWTRNAVNGYFTMGAKPQEIEIAEIEQYNRKTEETYHSGIEVYLKDYLGKAKRPIVGFVDRVTVDPRDDSKESVIVEDWKTGAKIRQWKPHTKSEDGLAEQRQQILYTLLLEKRGVKVAGARLIYPVARSIVTVDINDAKLRERAVSDLEKADEALDHLIETNLFEYTPSFLCAWCPLAKICPAKNIKPYAKMQEAYANQPEPEDFEGYVDY